MIPIKQPHLEAEKIALNICIHDQCDKTGANIPAKYGGVSYNGGFPQQFPWGFPTKNDHFGV